jgi:hypothetical protein
MHGHGQKRPGLSAACHVSSCGQETPRKKKRRRKDVDDLEDIESPEVFFEKVYQKHMSPKKYSLSGSLKTRDTATTQDSPSRSSFPIEKTANNLSPDKANQTLSRVLYDSSDDELDLLTSRSFSVSLSVKKDGDNVGDIEVKQSQLVADHGTLDKNSTRIEEALNNGQSKNFFTPLLTHYQIPDFSLVSVWS